MAFDLVQYFVEQMPIVTVKDGLLSTPENRPYLIKDKNKEIFIIFRPMSINAKKEDYEIIKTSTAVFQVLDWLPINHFKQYANTIHLLKEYISFGNSFIELEN